MFRCLSLALVLGLAMPARTQIVASGSDTSALMQGQFLEWGVNACGVFAVPGSLVASTSGLFGAYHPNVGAGLGAVYSPGGTWTGLDRCGDYWVPGSPEESFGLQWGTSPTVYKNASLSCFATDVPGNVRSFVATSGTQEVLWQGRTSDAAQTIRVRQTTRLEPMGRSVRTTVRLCNTGTVPVFDLFYARSTDPDNDQPLSGDFTTRNTVLSQPPAGAAVVTAEGLDLGCLLALVSGDPRARVAIGDAATTFALTSPRDLWEGGPGYETNVGSSRIQDWSIGIAFRIDTLEAAACTELTFYHIVDLATLYGLVDSLLPCPPPINLTAEARPNRANLRWDGPSSALGYRLFGGPAGGTPVVRNVAADSIRINGLNPGTTYQWTVRSICGVDTLSDAAPVQFFTTPLLRAAGALADWSMAPNPASGRVRLQGEDLSRAEVLELLDPAGRVLGRERLSGADAHDLALDGLAPGLYLVVLRGPAGTGHRQLVVE
jgi:hypothetical protein